MRWKDVLLGTLAIQGLTLFATRLSLICPFGLHKPRLPSRVVPHFRRLVWLDQPHLRPSGVQLYRGFGLRRAFEPTNHPAANRPDWYRGQAAFVRADRTSSRGIGSCDRGGRISAGGPLGFFPISSSTMESGSRRSTIRLPKGPSPRLASLFPCLFMGVTFPLLCDIFRSIPRNGHLPSVLYAWNTIGACSGVLACQFILIPEIGHQPTFWLMAGLNILLGLYFLASGGAPASDEAADTACVQYFQALEYHLGREVPSLLVPP